MSIRDKIRGRAKKSQKNCHTRTYIDGLIMKCKGCGEILRERTEIKDIYRQVTILMDDNSLHQTPMCLDCVKKKVPKTKLEAWYCADMLRWIETDKNEEVSFDFWELIYKKKPIRILNVEKLDHSDRIY